MKFKLISIVLLFTLCFTSCKSMQITADSIEPVAIATIYGNGTVPWYEEEERNVTYKVQRKDDGILTGLLNRALDGTNPETDFAQERINQAAEIVKATFETLDIDVVPIDQIGKKSSSGGIRKVYQTVANVVVAEGYDALSNSSKKLNRLILQETSAKTVFYISFTFQKQLVYEGVHPIGVVARVMMKVNGYNLDNKIIYNKEFVALSQDFTAYSNSSWNKEELCSFFYKACEDAVDQFVQDIKA